MDKDTDPPEPAQPTFQQAFAATLAKSGFARVKPGEKPDAGSLLGAVGGVRGLIEALLPPFIFLVIYTTTVQLTPAVVGSAGIAIVFILARLVKRLPAIPAVVGLLGILFSAVVAMLTGRDQDNFLPGLIVNAAYGSALLVTIIVRWPFIGVVSGLLTGDWNGWRKDPAKYRVALVTTWMWVGMFALRLVVQYPLYLAEEVSWLATAKLFLGTPLFAAVIWLTWLLARGAYSHTPSPPADSEGDDPAPSRAA